MMFGTTVFCCYAVDTLFYSIFKNLRLALFTATMYFGNNKYPYETSVDKGRAIAVIYQDLCKAFDMGSPNTLLSKLWRDGFDGWTEMDKELFGQQDPEDNGQWLRIPKISVSDGVP